MQASISHRTLAQRSTSDRRTLRKTAFTNGHTRSAVGITGSMVDSRRMQSCFTAVESSTLNSGVVVANLAYNEYVIGGGVDFALLSRINLRADYEYQTWLSFPSNRLTPQLVSIGVAYHFPGELEKGNRFR